MDIRVIGFKTIMSKKTGKPVEMVEYASAHSIQSATTVARVKDMMPKDGLTGDKAMHINAVWSFIEPHYKAWKEGVDMPEDGTPLSVWSGVTESQIFEFNQVGIRSVEDLAAAGDTAMDKVKLPNARALRKQAEAFIEARKEQDSAATIAALQERLAAAEAVIAEQSEPKKRGPGRPKKEDAA